MDKVEVTLANYSSSVSAHDHVTTDETHIRNSATGSARGADALARERIKGESHAMHEAW